VSGRKKKVYAAIVAVGLLALAVDRFVFSEPAPAAASAGSNGSSPAKRPAREASKGVVSLSATVAAEIFPRSIPRNDSTLARDAFEPTPTARQTLLGAGAAANTGNSLDGGTLPASSASDFRNAHKLLAVMTGPNLRVAIIDGQRVSIGQHIAGCELIEITGQSARFSCADSEVELRVSSLDEGNSD